MCGIVGAFSKNNDVASLTVSMLTDLQHRGQATWGIVTYEGNGERFHSHRDSGFIGEKPIPFELLAGSVAIAHVRYPTSGANNLRNAQPFFGETRFGGIGIAHNGNLRNAKEIRDSHLQEGIIYQSTSDTEVILHLIARSKKETFFECLIDALNQVKGAYSLVFLTEDRHIIAVRDPHGFWPISLGKKDGCYLVASETRVWNDPDMEFIREIEPGEMVDIFEFGYLSSFPFQKTPCSHCIFGQVYVSKPDSMIDKLLVSQSQYRTGKKLAEESPVVYNLSDGVPVEDSYFVAPVPESGIKAAEGYAKVLGLRSKSGIIRKWRARTFILPSQKLREEAARRKYCPDKGIVFGKNVIIVDDSIVRGTTLRVLVDMMRKAGAKEVHIRIASPPFKYCCQNGVDTPTTNELIASHMEIEEMRKYFNADSLAFLSLKGLHTAIGEHDFPKKTRFCDTCFSGIDPLS